MASPLLSASETVAHQTKGNAFPLTALTSLFFLWGFLTCLNDILIPHLKAVFSLTYTQAMLIQFCFFGAYFAVSIPAGWLIKRIGYQNGIVCGLLLAGLGCFMFYPAASMHTYGLFLGALFILASGITILQVSANPYVAALGSEESASSRLTMTQAFNALGTTVAPFFGATLILTAAGVGLDDVASSAESVKYPYLFLASVLMLLAVTFFFLKLPHIDSIEASKTNTESEPLVSIWQHKHLIFGVVGIFVYVGAEVAIGSFLVSFLSMDSVAGLNERSAAHYVAYYWGGAMVGRFVGAVVMRYVQPGLVLAFNATAAVALIGIAMVVEGPAAMWAILLVGLCNSIMFPTIFSLALKGLGPQTSQGSGLLCLAIVGGALIPLLQGVLADSMGLRPAFILPIICYLYLLFYGLQGHKVRP